jgi:hypothetical protein
MEPHDREAPGPRQGAGGCVIKAVGAALPENLNLSGREAIGLIVNGCFVPGPEIGRQRMEHLLNVRFIDARIPQSLQVLRVDVDSGIWLGGHGINLIHCMHVLIIAAPHK